MSTPTEPRLRRRRRLVWASILPALVLVVLALRFLTLPVHVGAAQDAHGTDDGAGIVAAGEKLGILNIVERWRAPFVEGTGKSVSGDLSGGRSDLELALARTSDPQDDCTVRTNLVITISQQADAAEEDGDEARTKALAKEGLALIKEGPKGCLDGQDDGNGGDAGRKQQEQQKKLQEQSGQQQEKDDEGQDGTDEKKDEGSGGEEQDPKKKELQERNQQGQSEAQEKKSQKEADSEGHPGGVEKPW
ncbi:hypothetical protein [Janibacter sp. GS2]|uniref:hypothetical protein n=1 Tax=Janibacter sp. GS2 TaxID=3442646 RepID=UPI003EB7FBE3